MPRIVIREKRHREPMDYLQRELDGYLAKGTDDQGRETCSIWDQDIWRLFAYPEVARVAFAPGAKVDWRVRAGNPHVVTITVRTAVGAR